MKYPIGIQSFDQIIEDGYVYVDKTEMIYSLVKEGKIYFLSRPRRFGKSLLLSTLKNYFLGRKELFKGLAIDRLEKDWLEYPVFHIDFNGSDFQEEGTLEKVIEEHISAWEKAYAILPDQSRDRGMRFIQVLREAHARVGRRAVVLIDEYDKPILDVLDTGLETVVGENRMSLEDRNRGILKGFYSVFKAADEHLQFVLLTGVTKFSQVSVFSGFNQPRDISMDEQFESLCGITGEELESYFAISIEELARKNELTVEEMKQLVKAQYDGYHFGTGLIDIYNPFSLLNAFISKRISDLPGSAVASHAGKPGRDDGSLLPDPGIRGLQGRRGEAVADDLPERLPDDQGFQQAPQHVLAGFPEQRGEERLLECSRLGLLEAPDGNKQLGAGCRGCLAGGEGGRVRRVVDLVLERHPLPDAAERERAGA